MSAERTVTVTLNADLTDFIEAADRAGRSIRVMALRIQGKRALADVVEQQTGRRIVREGLHDVRVWLGEATS